MKNNELSLLMEVIDQAYNTRAWHGTNLRGAIMRVPVELASWRPGRNRHNIWEIVVHAAYWKYTIRRRLLGEKRGSFPLKGSNFFARSQSMGEDAWRKDIRLLDEVHDSMRTAIGELSASTIHRISSGSKWTIAQLVYGIASHDIYHAGQIQLIKKLYQQR